MRYARSDLGLAQGPPPPGVMLEALCFHLQQAVERSLKAVLVARGIPFPFTHDIARLITTLIENQVPWCAALNPAVELTVYAVGTRSPRPHSPVVEAE